jgi:hypothetical protein
MPVVKEWKDEAESFRRYAELLVSSDVDVERLRGEIRQKIDASILSVNGLAQYENWLTNTLIHPAEQLLTRVREMQQSPYIALDNKELRSSIEPPLLYPDERLYNPLLEEDEREECIYQFRKVLYKLSDSVKCIRQVATVEIRRATTAPNRISLGFDQIESEPIAASNMRLTHPQIALLYHLNDNLITDNNADEIARKYGQTSGQRLMIEYKNLSSQLVRTARGRYTVKNYKAIELLVDERYKDKVARELSDAIKNNKR